MREYVPGAPSSRSLIDLFSGEWVSAVPGVAAATGHVPLFDDARIPWIVEQLGGIDGYRILELGPLEGGHTAMLLRAGAAEVHAVEANLRAYLRCLVVRELLDLRGARFLLGDLAEHVRAVATSWDGQSPAFDLVVASGVLYHLVDPVAVLADVAAITDRVFVWTHYVDQDLLDDHQDTPQGGRLGPGRPRALPDGTIVTSYPHAYDLDAIEPSFCGGATDTSTWMSLPDLRATLAALGLTQQVEAFDAPDHPNGPAIAILASRPEPRRSRADRPAPVWDLTSAPDEPVVERLPRPHELDALSSRRDEQAHRAEMAQARLADLESLLRRRDLRGMVRRALFPWREA